MTRKHEMVAKTWGREICFENNDNYCGKEMIVWKNYWSSKGKYHYHKIKDETFYVINGSLLLKVLDKDNVEQTIEMRQGDSWRIPPNTLHKFTALTDICIFIEVSTHHEDEDSYRVDPIV